MNQDRCGQTVLDMLYLVTCAANSSIPEKDRIRSMDLSAVCSIAEQHMLSAAVAMALESAKCGNEETSKILSGSIRRTIFFDTEKKNVLQALDENGIWHMPLKGALLKDLYPRYGMRQMADIDILIDANRSRDAKNIMEKLGFSAESFDEDNQDVYFKPPVCNFELHTSLFAPHHEEKLYQYYLNVQDRLIKDDDSRCGFHFTDEDYYIYMVAHEFKHYTGGGTGLRSLLDTYIFCMKKSAELDWGYIEAETEKLGIAEFEGKNRSLSSHLFGNSPLSESDRTMLDYILSSGAYGTPEHIHLNNASRFAGNFRQQAHYLLSRLFLPMSSVQEAYPFFYKHKVLLPILFLYRIGKGLTTRRSMVKEELQVLKNGKNADRP